MSKRTELVIASKLSLFEHRFVSGHAEEHRIFEVPAEHRVFDVVPEHRQVGTMAEHRSLQIAAEHRSLSSHTDALILNESTVKLRNPHVVSSVTVQRRSDGSFFLIIEE